MAADAICGSFAHNHRRAASYVDKILLAQRGLWRSVRSQLADIQALRVLIQLFEVCGGRWGLLGVLLGEHHAST